MIIALVLDNQTLEARCISDKNLSIDGYFEGLKKDMIEANEDILDLSEEKPVFKLTPFPSKTPDGN